MKAAAKRLKRVKIEAVVSFSEDFFSQPKVCFNDGDQPGFY